MNSNCFKFSLPGVTASQNSTAEAKASNKSHNRLSNLFSNMKIPKLKLTRKQNSGGGSKTGSPISGDEVDKNSSKPASPTKSESSDLKTSKFGRSMSVGSDDGNSLFVRGSTDRHSYRAPAATSRYMQAAEAYAKKRSDRYLLVLVSSGNCFPVQPIKSVSD